MHATAGRSYHLPQDEQSRRQIEESLKDLWEFVRELVELHLGVRHLSGGLVRAGFAAQANGMLSQCAPAVSDDQTPVHVDDAFAPAGGRIIRLTMGPISITPSPPFIATIVGSCGNSSLGEMSEIWRYGLVFPDGAAAALSELPGPLRLGSTVSSLELLVGLRVSNASGPRTHFSG